MTFPPIDINRLIEILTDIREENDWVSVAHDAECTQDEAFIDVRLQVYDNGEWIVRQGDPSYDTDHRGCWGASSIQAWMDPTTIHTIAEDLIDQAAEQWSMCHDHS